MKVEETGAKVDQQNKNEAQRLVIQNLSVLETAPAVVAEVEKRVFSEINVQIRDWVEAQDDWEGLFGFYNDVETTFKPRHWPVNESGEYCAYYTLGSNTDDSEFSYWLSSLVGAVAAEFGIKFQVDQSYVTRLSGKGTRPGAAWKAFLAREFAERPLLKEAGFQLHGDFLFLPIHLDATTLADLYPDSLAEAFGPLNDGLDRVAKAHQALDQLLSSALEHQFAKSVSREAG